MANVSLLVPKILKWEGGYQCDPDDTGNYLNNELIGTNRGITPAAYQRAFGIIPTKFQMQNLTDSDFEYILKKFYWDRWQADLIKNQSIAELLVDWVWGSGVHGIKKPQEVLGVNPDGYVGKLTLFAINNEPEPEILFLKLKKSRIDFIQSIATGKKSKYLKGWLNRVNDFNFKP